VGKPIKADQKGLQQMIMSALWTAWSRLKSGTEECEIAILGWRSLSRATRDVVRAEGASQGREIRQMWSMEGKS
jgi:hypothetical protein